MSPVRSRLWDGSALLGGDGEAPGWSDPWVGGTLIGTLKPVGGTNVGAGLLEGRPYPTATIATGTGITYNATSKRYTISTVVTDRVIPGFVTLTATGELENCEIQAPPVEYTSGYTALVEGPATVGQGKIRWTTIKPTVASAYYDGIGRGVEAYYCDVQGVIDGVRGFSTSVNGARIQCYAVHFHSSPQFRPDYAHSGGRPETHNDIVIQAQGNPNGDDNDILFDGCWGDARHSTTQGTTPATRDQIAAIMITPAASQGAVHMTYRNGWLTGGIYCVNGGSDGVDDYGPSSLVLTGNRFERPGTDVYGDGRAPDVAIALDSHLIRTVSGNVYEDNGLPVPVTNA